jgi:hypothetical protein
MILSSFRDRLKDNGHPAVAVSLLALLSSEGKNAVKSPLTLWPPVLRRYAVLAKTARLLGVTGRLQVQAEVVHLIARQLWIPRLPQTPTTNASRDFRWARINKR